MCACLPLEIIHIIFLELDIETYAAARLTCRSWRHAASCPSILRRILQRTPLQLPPLTGLTVEQWNLYFSQVSRLDLYGRRGRIVKKQYQRELPQKCIASAVAAASHDNRRLVALQGAQAIVYDQERKPFCEFSLSLSLYPLWTTVCLAVMKGATAGYMPFRQQYARHHISVSSHGHLVAVGLGRTVQIYGLSGNEEDFNRPAEYRLGQCGTAFLYNPGSGYEETDGVIEYLEFADNDTLLRVVIGKDTTLYRPARVQYLGDPVNAPATVDLAYWRANINRIYLDSVALGIALGAENQARLECVFRGLQLLPSSYNPTEGHHEPSHTRPEPSARNAGRYFVAALQTASTNAYCIGHVLSATTNSPTTHQQTQTVKICHTLPSIHNGHNQPSKPSTQNLTLYNPLPTIYNNKKKDTAQLRSNLQSLISRYSPLNLPTATFSFPLLAVSPDARLLAIYEPGGAGVTYNPHFTAPCISPGGSLYICSLETHTSICPLNQTRNQKQTQKQGTNPRSHDTSSSLQSDMLPPWPFLLDNVSVDIESLCISSNVRGSSEGEIESEAETNTGKPLDGKLWKTYQVTAVAKGQVLEWNLN